MAGAELYLYWHASPADTQAVKAAVQTWQAALRRQHSGLQARLLQRAEAAAQKTTWMETYTLPGGVGAVLQQQIVERGDAVTAPWRGGPRHLEVFTEPA